MTPEYTPYGFSDNITPGPSSRLPSMIARFSSLQVILLVEELLLVLQKKEMLNDKLAEATRIASS
jgi:hypothetical protein